VADMGVVTEATPVAGTRTLPTPLKHMLPFMHMSARLTRRPCTVAAVTQQWRGGPLWAGPLFAALRIPGTTTTGITTAVDRGTGTEVMAAGDTADPDTDMASRITTACRTTFPTVFRITAGRITRGRTTALSVMLLRMRSDQTMSALTV